MKKSALFFTIMVLLLSGSISYAQNSILAGKIVDENNKAIPGARLIISKQNEIIQELWADDDGLYYSKLLDETSYHIEIVANGKHLKAKKFFLDAGSGRKNYYIMRMLDDKVVIDKVNEDPSLKVKLSKIEQDSDPYHTVFFDGGTYFTVYKVDSSAGKIEPIISSGAPMPGMK